MAESHEPFAPADDLATARGLGLVRLEIKECQEHFDREVKSLRLQIAELRAELVQILMRGTEGNRPVAALARVVAASCRGGKWVAVALGVGSVLVQIASAYRPDLKGPLTELLQLLGAER